MRKNITQCTRRLRWFAKRTIENELDIWTTSFVLLNKLYVATSAGREKHGTGNIQGVDVRVLMSNFWSWLQRVLWLNWTFCELRGMYTGMSEPFCQCSLAQTLFSLAIWNVLALTKFPGFTNKMTVLSFLLVLYVGNNYRTQHQTLAHAATLNA